MAKQVPRVAIVGRANVGKSTLFNRLADNVTSMTLDYEGVTRDILKDTVAWDDKRFELIDTGGLVMSTPTDPVVAHIREKALAMVDQARTIVCVVDGKAGVMADDAELIQMLRKKTEHLIIAVNKSDTRVAQENFYDFYQLPHDVVLPVSGEHGMGVGELLDAIVATLPKDTPQASEDAEYRVTLLGRPNVGKSSLLNVLLGQERMLVEDKPGTTREAVSESRAFYKGRITLTDTPGVRRQGAVDEGIEELMVKSSLRAVRNSDVVLLMIDATQAAFVHQELKLAFYAFQEEGAALILVVNKMDICSHEAKQALQKSFDYYAHLMKKIPVVYISCHSGKNVGKILPLVHHVYKRYTQWFDQERLSQLLMTAVQKRPLFHTGHELRVKGAAQVATGPCTVAVAANYPQYFGEAECRFLENVMRKVYDVQGVPLQFRMRKRITE